MRFESNLIQGKLIKRYKRFLADVQLGSGEVITAHVPNSGSMIGVNSPGSAVYISKSQNPNRKLPHTLEIVVSDKKSKVGVNTSLTNKLVLEAFNNKLIPGWKKFSAIKPEVKINPETRLDFLLSSEKLKRYVEVKNVSMARPPLAVFPDAVTTRGQKHLQELIKLQDNKTQCEILFVVQREDCSEFSPCDDIDPEYGKLLRKAQKEGVIVSCWSCEVSSNSIELAKPLKIRL